MPNGEMVTHTDEKRGDGLGFRSGLTVYDENLPSADGSFMGEGFKSLPACPVPGAAMVFEYQIYRFDCRFFDYQNPVTVLDNNNYILIQ